MKTIPVSEATAAQMRAYFQEVTGTALHETASRKSVLAKLEERGLEVKEITVSDEEAAVVAEARAAAPEAGMEERETHISEVSPEALAEAIKASFPGISEGDAAKLAGLTVHQHISGAVRSGKEKPYGPGKENKWVVIRLGKSEGRFGEEHVPVSVNGVAQYIPRGRDVPIRTPYLEVLHHAEKIVYTQRTLPDGRRTLDPRVVLTYPVEFVSQQLYDSRNDAEAAIAA